MCTIKISKEGSYYLSKDDKRVTEDFDEIEKINDKYFSLEKRHGVTACYSIYNSNTCEIDLTVNDGESIDISRERFPRFYFTIRRSEFFTVYDSITLKEIVSVKRKKGTYSYAYIGEGFSIYEETIYNREELLGNLEDFPIIYSKEESDIYIRKIKEFNFFSIEREDYGLEFRINTILKYDLPSKIDDIIFKNFSEFDELVLFTRTGKTFNVTSGDRLIYHGPIDLGPFVQHNNSQKKYDLIHFYVDQKLYLITKNKNLYGPFEISEFNTNHCIFYSLDYTIFLSDGYLIKYNNQSHAVEVNKCKYNFNKNEKYGDLIIENKEYSLLRIGECNYYYNDNIEDFTILQISEKICPNSYINEILYLDENLNEMSITPEWDIRDLIISDYTYYKNRLYVIFRDELIEEPAGKYVVYDVTNKVILKTFNSFIEFSSHKNFYLTDWKFHASSFVYTLDEKGTKIIKLPFKIRSILIENQGFRIKNMNYKEALLPNNEAIYLKES